MDTKQLNTLLQKRKCELLNELKGIDLLLGVYNDSVVSSQGNQNAAFNIDKTVDILVKEPNADFNEVSPFKDSNFYPKTDDITWKEYLFEAVKLLGKTKVANVIDLVVKSNGGSITPKRVKEAAGNKFKELVLENKLGVEETNSRKAGYTYYIKS